MCCWRCRAVQRGRHDHRLHAAHLSDSVLPWFVFASRCSTVSPALAAAASAADTMRGGASSTLGVIALLVLAVRGWLLRTIAGYDSGTTVESALTGARP
jgi:hypothetical protein